MDADIDRSRNSAGVDLLRREGRMAAGSIPDGCVLRFYAEGDDERMVELLKEAFGEWPAHGIAVPALAHLRWKLHSAPDALRYHVVAEIGEQAVACRLFVLQRVKFGDRSLTVRQGVDTSVRPEYRGRGLMIAMTYPIPERLREFDADFSVRSGEDALERAVQYDERKNVYAMVDVLRRGSAATSDIDDSSACDIRTVERFDERFDEFSTRAAAPFWCIVERAPKYLNWRFADARAGAFTVRVAEERGRVVGYAALCARSGRGSIADLLALPGRDDVVASLIGDSIAQLGRAGARTIECWSTRNHPYRHALSRYGFDDKRRTMQFYCQPIRVEDEVVAPFGGRDAIMHLVSGDTDLV